MIELHWTAAGSDSLAHSFAFARDSRSRSQLLCQRPVLHSLHHRGDDGALVIFFMSECLVDSRPFTVRLNRLGSLVGAWMNFAA